MNRNDALKALAVVPFIIAGGMAMMLLSYMLVPLMIIFVVGTIAYAFITAFNDEEQ